MRIYWTLASIPELAPLPKGERARIWRCVYWKSLCHWQMWAVFVSCSVIMAALQSLLHPFGLRFVGTILGSGLAGFLGGQIAMRMARLYIREMIEAEGTKGRE